MTVASQLVNSNYETIKTIGVRKQNDGALELMALTIGSFSLPNMENFYLSCQPRPPNLRRKTIFNLRP